MPLRAAFSRASSIGRTDDLHPDDTRRLTADKDADAAGAAVQVIDRLVPRQFRIIAGDLVETFRPAGYWSGKRIGGRS